MSIDWLTVVAQIINFLVLVWLLKKFLYRPILDGIAAREAEIAKRINDAEQAKISASKAEAEFLSAKAQCLAEQEDLLDQAMAQTQAQRDALLSKAHQQMSEEQAQAKQQLQQEKITFLQQLRQSSVDDLLQVSKKMLEDLADETLENAIARQLVKRMESILPELRSSTLGYQQGEIRTSLALNEESKKLLQQQLQQLLPHISFTFLVSEQQALGVSLHIGGVEVVWTLNSYIDELSERYQQQSTMV